MAERAWHWGFCLVVGSTSLVTPSYRSIRTSPLLGPVPPLERNISLERGPAPLGAVLGVAREIVECDVMRTQRKGVLEPPIARAMPTCKCGVYEVTF